MVQFELGVVTFKGGLRGLRRGHVSSSLVGEESRNSEMFFIGFQDFLGVVHFFFGYP